MQIHNICFSGGGSRGIVYIGVLQYLYKYGYMNNVRRIAGTSVGAVFALMCTCGLTYETIFELFSGFDSSSVISSGVVNFFHATERMYQRYGWNSHEGLTAMVRSICEKAFDLSDLTFEKLYQETGRDLVVCCTDVKACKSVYFSYDTHPNTSVVEAVVASASIPLLFEPCIIDDRPFIDGGVLNNFPMNYFTNVQEKENTLGLLIYAPDDQIDDDTMSSFVNYSGRIIFSMLNRIQNLQISQMNNENTITLIVTGLKPTVFDISQEDRDRIVNDGYIMTEAFFKRRASKTASAITTATNTIKTIRTAISQLWYKIVKFNK